jgi:hypothetical protein
VALAHRFACDRCSCRARAPREPLLIVATTYLIHKGSHESKDSQHKMQRAIDRIERRLESLGRKAA